MKKTSVKNMLDNGYNSLSISVVEDLRQYNEDNPRNQREYKYIVHYDMWHLFSTNEKHIYKEFLEKFNIKKELRNDSDNFKYYVTNTFYKDTNGGFWSLKDLPLDAKHIKGMSNGSLVDCFYTLDYKGNDNVLTVYRPNPNAKNVYVPLDDLQEHFYYRKNFLTI